MRPFTASHPQKELKLMTLNIWGGTVLGPLIDFIKDHRDTDIFCFQEVYSCATEMVADFVEDPVVLDIQEKIAEILPDHIPYFRPVLNGSYGISTFVHKDIQVVEEGEHEVHTAENYSGCGPAHSRILQWLRFSTDDQDLTVINLHGLWNGKGKGDAPERILQSNRIKEFTDTLETPFILCGDFNIKPGTQSLDILSSGMQNLIEEHNIQSTRSEFYKKPERFADYIFLSEGIKALGFKVLDDPVSDHLPLILRFSNSF